MPRAEPALPQVAPLRLPAVVGVAIRTEITTTLRLTTKLTGGNAAQRNCRPVQRLVSSRDRLFRGNCVNKPNPHG